MGREEPSKGDAGEGIAGEYLRKSFTDRAKTQRGSAVDWICRGLRAKRSLNVLYYEPTVVFHFQIKYTDRPVSITRSTFHEWLLLFETQPVMLLVVSETKPKQWDVWYLCLHDWLLSDRGQKALCDNSQLSLNLTDDFTLSDENDINFHNTLLAEADRAVASNQSPWSTLRDYGLVPFDEGLFLQYLDLATHAEAPVTIVRKDVIPAAYPECN